MVFIPGPSTSALCKRDGEEGRGSHFPLHGFPLQQLHDETLRHTFDQVRVNLQLNVLLSHQSFSIIKERLYRVTQDTQTKDDPVVGSKEL